MITDVLAWSPGLMKLLAVIFVFIVPVLLVVLFVVFIRRSNKKRREVQMELDRFADELEQIREQATGRSKSNSKS